MPPSNHFGSRDRRRGWVVPAIIATVIFIGGVVGNLVANYIQAGLDSYKSWVWMSFGIVLIITIIAAIREAHSSNKSSPESFVSESLSKSEAIVVSATPLLIQPQTIINSLHQIPSPPADFTGRESEIAELMTNIEDGGVTISGLQGLGGVGKTALAIKLAELLKERYPDAQFYLDLRGTGSQSVRTADALAHIIHAYYPGAKLPESEAELRGLYLSVLHNQRAILLMDNARDQEQVEVLIPPAGCVLLVTSRQYFALPGIFAKRLDSLPPTDACRLLLAITPRIGEMAEEFARLCGYLPLALRLAASALAERPNIRPADYTQQLANTQKRLELIEASLSLSYALLSEDLQQCWRALAVFPGTFDEAAAAAVWEVEQGKSQEYLSRLLAFSLIEWNEGTERHRLHDLARVFAHSRLSGAEYQDGRQRHAVHYQQVLATADGLYLNGGVAIAHGLALFDREWTNIEAGHGWAAEQVWNDETVAKLCIAYPDAGMNVLILRRHPSERIQWLEAMLAAARRLKQRDAEGRALNSLGQTYKDWSQTRRAMECYEQALVIAREIGDRRDEGLALGGLGIAYARLGETRRALGFHERHLTIARETGDLRNEGKALWNIAIARYTLGETKRAIEFHEQGLKIARGTGDRKGEGQALGGLGLAYADLGETNRAIEFHERHLVITRETGDRRGEGIALGHLGLAYAALGEMPRAIQFHEQGREIARETGNRRGEGVALGNLGLTYAALGETHRAIQFYEQYLEIARETGDRSSEGGALGNLGLAYAALGETRRAIQFYEQYLEIARETGDRSSEDGALGNLGLTYAAVGETRRAIQFYEQYLEIARETGDRSSEGRALWNTALALQVLGEWARAIACAEAALVIYEQIEAPHAEGVRNKLVEWKTSEGGSRE